MELVKLATINALLAMEHSIINATVVLKITLLVLVITSLITLALKLVP